MISNYILFLRIKKYFFEQSKNIEKNFNSAARLGSWSCNQVHSSYQLLFIIKLRSNNSCIARLKSFITKLNFLHYNFLHLNSYNIVYSRKKRWMPFKILLQTPKILRAVNQEHEWLKNLLANRAI